MAPSGEIVAGLPPSNTDSRRGRAWSVTSHKVLLASQGGPLVALTRMRRSRENAMASTLSLLDGSHLLSLMALGTMGRITSAGRPKMMAAKMAM